MSGMVLAAVLGEWLCLQRELQEIPIGAPLRGATLPYPSPVGYPAGAISRRFTYKDMHRPLFHLAAVSQGPLCPTAAAVALQARTNQHPLHTEASAVCCCTDACAGAASARMC